MFASLPRSNKNTWTHQWIKQLHPGKLTSPLKRYYFNRQYIFQPSIFRGHVSFRECICLGWLFQNAKAKRALLDVVAFPTNIRELLMAEIANNHLLDVWKPINNGISYQPQLVQDFSHQQYLSYLDVFWWIFFLGKTKLTYHICKMGPNHL